MENTNVSLGNFSKKIFWDKAVNRIGKKCKHQWIQKLPTLYDILGTVIEEHKSDKMKQFWDVGHKIKLTSLSGEDGHLYRMIVKHQVIYQAQESKAEGVKEVLFYV